MLKADETYIGGKEINKHYPKKRSDENPDLTNEGKAYKPKKVVVGIIERNGDVVLKYIPNATKRHMVSFLRKHAPEGSKLYTDESNVYGKVGKWCTHDTVKHALGVYVTGNVHINTIENFWSVLKRGLYGIYHQVSDKHIERYLDEFSSRFNTRHLSSKARFENFLEQSESPLPYKRLIA